MGLRDHYRWYVSLERVKDELGINETVTTWDAALKRDIERASVWVERATRGRIFIPETRTYYFDLKDSARLVLGRDLLAVTALADDQGAIASGDYFLYSGFSDLNTPPYQAIELLRSTEFFYFADTRQKAITVTGLWGYTADYEDTGTTVPDGGLSDSATMLTLAGLETGWSLLIGSEQIFVAGMEGYAATLRRAQGGTAAAAHAEGTAIYRYLPPADIEGAVSEIVRAWHQRRANPQVKRETIGDYTVEYFGETVPQAAAATVRRYQRLVLP